MEDKLKKQNDKFAFTYSASQQKEIERIREKYIPKKEDKMEKLRRLDRETEKSGSVVAITVGIVGVLTLGIGMCCCMVWAEKFFGLGIIIGVFGMVMTGIAYPMYKKITEKKRAKYAKQILELANELVLQ